MNAHLKYDEDLISLFTDLINTKVDKAIFEIIVSTMDDDEKLKRIIAIIERGANDKD